MRRPRYGTLPTRRRLGFDRSAGRLPVRLGHDQQGPDGCPLAIATVNDYEQNDEDFSVHLTGASDGAVSLALGSPSMASVCLENHVAGPAVTVSGPPATVEAGNPADFTLSISEQCGFPVRVYYESEEGAASPALQGDAEYGSVTIGIGNTQAVLAVGTVNDGLYEQNDEDFYVQLTGVSAVGSVAVGRAERGRRLPCEQCPRARREHRRPHDGSLRGQYRLVPINPFG